MKAKNKSLLYNIVGIAGCFLLIVIDQLTKILVVENLKDREPFILINGVFELQYLENRGAAFGILENQKIFFIISGVIILAGIGYVYTRIPDSRKYMPLRIVSILMAAGAVGNMIDRIRNSYVIDFLYFKLIDFPIFNVADCYVTIAAGLLMVLFLFIYKESDLDFISLKKDRNDN